jgi:Ca2+/Na+ antiporter
MIELGCLIILALMLIGGVAIGTAIYLSIYIFIGVALIALLLFVLNKPKEALTLGILCLIVYIICMIINFIQVGIIPWISDPVNISLLVVVLIIYFIFYMYCEARSDNISKNKGKDNSKEGKKERRTQIANASMEESKRQYNLSKQEKSSDLRDF